LRFVPPRSTPATSRGRWLIADPFAAPDLTGRASTHGERFDGHPPDGDLDTLTPQANLGTHRSAALSARSVRLQDNLAVDQQPDAIDRDLQAEGVPAGRQLQATRGELPI